MNTPRMQFATSMACIRAEEIEQAVDDYRNDVHFGRRMKACECRSCFYFRGRMAGAAMTRWTCGLCGDDRVHPNTATPSVCAGCGQCYRICTFCGGDLDMRVKRENWPTPAPALLEEENEDHPEEET